MFRSFRDIPYREFDSMPMEDCDLLAESQEEKARRRDPRLSKYLE